MTIHIASGGGKVKGFSAYLSAAQNNIVTGTWTKVLCNTEEYDTEAAYDNATNYRFTAVKAGIHSFKACVQWLSAVDQTAMQISFKVNGTTFIKQGNYLEASGTGVHQIVIAADINLAVGDYVELFALQGSGSNKNIGGGQSVTFFQGSFQ